MGVCLVGASVAVGLLTVLTLGPARTFSWTFSWTLAAAWTALPLLLAIFVSLTGRLHAARMVLLTCIVTTLAAVSVVAGYGAMALLWFCVLPLEMGLAGGPRDILNGLYAAAAGIVALAGGALFLDAPQLASALVSLGLLGLALPAVLIYACLLAWRVEWRRRIASRREAADRNRFRLLAAHSSDLITCHGLDGETLFASDAADSLFGCAADDLKGAGLFGRVHLHDRIAFREALTQAAKGDETRVEFRAAGPKGGWAWLEMRCRPVLGVGGEVSDVVGVSRDVSAARDRTAALEAERERAEADSRAKSRFLAVVSHELRTPLNAIIGFSDLIRTLDGAQGALGPVRRLEYVDLIHESGTHLLRLVNDVLDMSKIEAGAYDLTPEAFGPAEALAACAAMLGPVADEAGVTVDVIASEPPAIEADPRAFRQVVINLLNNAVKFSPEGGRVTLDATRADGMLKITVADEGAGIAPDDLERLGRPFTQACAGTDRAHEGAGLGLSIVKGLVELHGGTLAIASRLGDGTRVSVTFPLADEKTEAGDSNVVPLDAAREDVGADATDASTSGVEYGRVSA